jgi:hypothetical protein
MGGLKSFCGGGLITTFQVYGHPRGSMGLQGFEQERQRAKCNS